MFVSRISFDRRVSVTQNPGRLSRDAVVDGRVPARTHGSAAPAARAHRPALDAGVLARLRELDPSGATRLVERVMQTFESSAARLRAQLESARGAADRTSMRFVAHTLKSASAGIGALELSHLCAKAEAAVLGGSSDSVAIDAALDAMTAALDDTLLAIGGLLQDNLA